MASTVGDRLYQGIKANRAADDIPDCAKGQGSETLLPEGRGGRHDVDGIGSPREEVFIFTYGMVFKRATSGLAAPFEKESTEV